ncbi:MAG: hypothetical protein LBN07_03875 [Christensenellaceae bacterium]|jgi:hypothetical protein|nr:hypothetical protein [Christensenellaceae bacterium]
MKGNLISHTCGGQLHNMNKAEQLNDPLYKEMILGINGEFEQIDNYALFEYEEWLAKL